MQRCTAPESARASTSTGCKSARRGFFSVIFALTSPTKKSPGGLLRFIRFRQPDSAVGVGEVLGEVLAVERLHPRPPPATPAKFRQHVKAHGMELPQVHDHFR